MSSSFSSRNHRYADEQIRYCIVESDLGCLLVAATKHGICLTEINNDPEQSVEYALERFKMARVERCQDDPELLDWAKQARDYLCENHQVWTAPLDIRGTDFQLSVWQRLMEIGPGDTTTYGSIASDLDRPKASRAVGAALGHNPIAVHIPCHRVIGANGNLTGFRWGLALKRQILHREGIVV